MQSCFLSLWAINAPLEVDRMRRQIDELRESGIEGVVFHPRFYPGNPAYLSDRYLTVLGEAILHARTVGMKFWIYDENGWPSGASDGQLLRRFPEYTQRWVGMVTSPPDRCLGTFSWNNRQFFLAEEQGQGVDYFQIGTVHAFIELTHERYRAGLDPVAFEHVEAFFCDEPEFGLGHAFSHLPPGGAIPWTSELPHLFRERCGEDLIRLLPLLFVPEDGFEEVRIRFWDLLSDLFCTSFIIPLNEWCVRHGKLFTAHMKGEEHPLFQVPMAGCFHRIFRHIGLPGIDALERNPSNDFYPRQVSSAARQFHDGRCMAEVFGGAGWGAGPADLERYLCWLGGHGVTDFVLHLSQYRLDSAAICDWPPSLPRHLSWRTVFPEVIARVRRSLAASPRPPAEVLVVAPYREITARFLPADLLAANIHDGSDFPSSGVRAINDRFLDLVKNLREDGVAYDVIDERSLEEFGDLAGGDIRVGHCRYSRLVATEGCRLSDAFRLKTQLPGERPVLNLHTESRSRSDVEVLPLQWNLGVIVQNRLFLESESRGDLWFEAVLENRFPENEPLPSVEVIFADIVENVVCNGVEIPLDNRGDEGSRVWVSSRQLCPGANVLRFRVSREVVSPFAWVEGAFRVLSQSSFTRVDDLLVKTAGPFGIFPLMPSLGGGLIETGFPFLFQPLEICAETLLPEGVGMIELDGLVADASRLTLGEWEFDWMWDGRCQYCLPRNLASGLQCLRLKVVPNTYNVFGPHHYYRGDWTVVSPAQMRGERNFADPSDAPPRTHVGEWHFRRLVLPESMVVYR